MDNIQVSIIMPSYRAKSFLTKTISSVIDQSLAEWELLIVDDCSPDNSNTIISHYTKKDPRVKLLKLETNSGPAIARNRGIKEAKGRYIAFLDSDDIWHPEKLEKQLQFMQENYTAISFTAYNMIDEKTGQPIAVHKVPKTITYKELLKSNVIGCSTVIYDTEKIGKVNFPIIQKRQDFALWLKILKRHEPAYGLQEVLVDYMVRTDSVSSNRLSAAYFTWKVYREIEKLPFLKALYYFIHYALRGLNKYWL